MPPTSSARLPFQACDKATETRPAKGHLTQAMVGEHCLRVFAPFTAMLGASNSPALQGLGPPPMEARLHLRSQPVGLILAAHAQSAPQVGQEWRAPTADSFFAWAEYFFPEHFPAGPPTESEAGYVLRRYGATNTLLGVTSEGQIYAKGNATDAQLAYLGQLADFACLISPSGCLRALAAEPDGALTSTGMGNFPPSAPAQSNVSTSFCSDGVYPQRWQLESSSTDHVARGATAGTPEVRHIRDGKVIAIYRKLGGDRSKPNNTNGTDTSVGPFRRAPYTQWKDGDIFELMPAVYEGEDQQIYIGPNIENDAAYQDRRYQTPRNIRIRGVTINGERPVIKLPASGGSNATFGQGLIYVDSSENIVIENIEIASNDYGKGTVGKAAVYVTKARNLTLRNIRIAGFHNKSANGIFSTSDASGTLRLENVDLDGNGGGNGPEHNIYVNASRVDPYFTVKMVGSWSRNSRYGHLFKSRAQINILEGNYFEGSLSSGAGDNRESFQLDLPEGGAALVRNNLFTKVWSGDNSNGASVTYAVEKDTGTFGRLRPWALHVEHNTFVSFTRYYDSQQHAPYPFFIRRTAPLRAPLDHVVSANVFVGYCQTPSDSIGSGSYRGSSYQILDFNGISSDYRAREPKQVADNRVLGTPSYVHERSVKRRETATIGAFD